LQTASFFQETAGSQRTPKKKYNQLKKRVKRAICGRTEWSSDIFACYGSSVMVL